MNYKAQAAPYYRVSSGVHFLSLLTMVLSVLLLTVSTTHAQENNKKEMKMEKALFAGGCFWCMEPPFDNQEGVSTTIVGYTGGKKEKANYQDIGTGESGHREAIEVSYDPKVVPYAQLITIFWENIDPYDGSGQFVDRGTQYTTAIYYSNDGQRVAAEASKRALEEKSGKKVATAIVPAEKFYAAEDYHQDFYLKNEAHYKRYKKGSGR